MASLPAETIRDLLQPFVSPFGPELALSDVLIHQISTYLDLLLRWNARVSLTAIRDPEEIVQRHFGESLFTAGHLSRKLFHVEHFGNSPTSPAELLDYGTGPGFPGLPIQLALPSLHVTLAESQAKKVAFLRQVIHSLHLPTEIWPSRVEQLPPDRRFDVITLRAVEKMELSVEAAAARLRPQGWLAALVGSEISLPGALEFPIPTSDRRRLLLSQNVPRGTLLPS